MPECSLCGVTAQSPCGVICLSDCSVCWVTVATAEAIFAADGKAGTGGIARFAKTDKEVVLDDKTQLRVCSTGASAAQLAALINHVYPGSASSKENAPMTKQASGTLPDIIKALGLEPAAK